MIIIPVKSAESGQFREILVEYWRDLVPDAPFLKDPIVAEAQFNQRYRWNGGSNNPFWAIVDGHCIGFFMYRIYDDHVTAYIHDFFVKPAARRQRHGTEMYRQLLTLLKVKGIAQIGLSVLEDNPTALSFWREQGFEIEYHRLSQRIDTHS